MMKMKLNKKIAGATAMLMLSATMLGTSTFAWFTMNKEVSVTGMKLKATAENGLVISNYTKANWATSWTETYGGAGSGALAVAVLAPTSTDGNTEHWVRAQSSQIDDAEKNTPTGGYTDLTLTYNNRPTTGEGIGSASRTVTVGTPSGSTTINTDYVLLRKFYIKGSGDADWNANLVIDKVEATVEGTTTSANLDKSLRVLVVVGQDAFIYAPISGHDTACKYKGTTTLTLKESTEDSTCTNTTVIPNATTNAPIEVQMYMYFEGEDENCKSSNASGISLDEITISANFKAVDIVGP